MKHKKKLFALVAVILLVVIAIYVRKELKIDSCLDGGGRWNYQTSVCEKS
jgi:hypothetical protein